ncbi:MAG: hypothetical protein GXO10_05115 [Crenarchaeota archaeon]|nr:hypothetical protein [Thermoproteota archaeon]
MITHEILSKIARYYIGKYFNWLFEGPRENQFAVYEVLECRSKVMFTRSLPYTIVNTIISPSSIIGMLLHEGFGTVFSEECRDYCRIYSREVEVDGVRYVINGWPDYYDGRKIIELKYTGHPVREPDQKHVQQVRMYMWLTSAKIGYLLYVTPRKIYEFEITDPMTDTEVVDLLRNWTSPRDPSECSQCMFRNVCPYCIEKVEKTREQVTQDRETR